MPGLNKPHLLYLSTILCFFFCMHQLPLYTRNSPGSFISKHLVPKKEIGFHSERQCLDQAPSCEQEAAEKSTPVHQQLDKPHFHPTSRSAEGHCCATLAL